MEPPRQQELEQQPDDLNPDASDTMPPLEGHDDQQVATAGDTAVAGGDTFLLLDLPPNTTVGCDAKAINTGPSSPTSFQGLRGIPPTGAHFIWASAPDAMSRCGYWFITTKGQQVRVKQWDAFNEVLVTPPSAFEVRDLRANAAALHPQLVPYGFDGVAFAPSSAAAVGDGEGKEDEAALLLWRRLTGCVSAKVLGRVVTGKASEGSADADAEWLVDTSDGAAGDSAGASFLQQRQQQQQQSVNTKKTATQTLVGGGTGELHFLFPEGDVDVHTATMTRTAGPDSSIHADLPDTSMDILRLVDTPGTGVAEDDLVGELQFAFLTGLHLSNLACIEHWWHLVLKVWLRAHTLVLQRPRLSRAFLVTFHAQMVYNETHITAASSSAQQQPDLGLLLDVIPGNKRRLREALTLYKRRMNELLLDLPGGQATPEQGEVGKAFAEVEEWVWRFGWDLRADYVNEKREGRDGEGEDNGYEDDDDEYRPVIVDLDSDGKEVGLVSFN